MPVKAFVSQQVGQQVDLLSPLSATPPRWALSSPSLGLKAQHGQAAYLLYYRTFATGTVST